MPDHPRLACLFVPLFPLAARLRSEPNLAGETVVLLEGNGTAARVVAASRPARRAGIRPGQTLSQARALVPKLVARARDRESECASQDALADVAETFSPRVESPGGGVVYLDATGLERHFPTEKELARALAAAAQKAGLPARVGLARSKLAARIAAEASTDEPTIVADGEEPRFLAPLPLARLAPHLDVAEALARWGIRSIGELARLPEAEIASRLGRLGQELHETACGYDPHPLVPRLPPPLFREAMELEWPVVTLEPFLFLAHAALERLSKRLESHGLAATKLELELGLEPDGHDLRTIDLPAPTRDPKTLLTLTRLGLEARPPGAPVSRFGFVAHPDRPRRAQLTLFGPPALSPDKLATTIARLAALLGADRVGSPRPADSHSPGSGFTVDFAPPPPPDLRRPARKGRGLLAVRVLRPAVPLEVVVAEDVPQREWTPDKPDRWRVPEERFGPPREGDDWPRVAEGVDRAADENVRADNRSAIAAGTASAPRAAAAPAPGVPAAVAASVPAATTAPRDSSRLAPLSIRVLPPTEAGAPPPPAPFIYFGVVVKGEVTNLVLNF